MTDTELAVADDLVLSLDYTLRLRDGEVIGTTTIDDHDPLRFLQGRGQLFSGLEQALLGMAVGDEKDVMIAAVDGFGDWDPDPTLLVPHEDFPRT